MSSDAIALTIKPRGLGALRARSVLGALAAASGLAATGCTATFTPEPAAVVYETPDIEVSTVPYDIYAYPHVYFGGTWVYLVDGRWYYRGSTGWRVYREEPRELSRYRTHTQPVPSYREAPREYHRERRPQ